ncbi:MAG: RHS repeat-associated core domain-containing protein, partial [Phycisphaeraceae bacterium]|nr:RHS repeat-associated core domain-containing protein [Phycisphaeraceae bacterium]
TLYYTVDANKNVTALIDATTGNVVERYLYDPYGRVMVLDDGWNTVAWSASRKNEILFAGYRYNPETGYYHARHREYHPLLGRFMQRDPLGYVDGGNLYAGYFVMWGGVDPMGLCYLVCKRDTCRFRVVDYTPTSIHFSIGTFSREGRERARFGVTIGAIDPGAMTPEEWAKEQIRSVMRRYMNQIITNNLTRGELRILRGRANAIIPTLHAAENILVTDTRLQLQFSVRIERRNCDQYRDSLFVRVFGGSRHMVHGPTIHETHNIWVTSAIVSYDPANILLSDHNEVLRGVRYVLAKTKTNAATIGSYKPEIERAVASITGCALYTRSSFY